MINQKSKHQITPPRSAYVPPLTHLLDAMRDDGTPISPSPFPIGKGAQGVRWEPTAPRTFSPMTHRIGIPDVADQTLEQYMNIKPNPNEAMMHARLDKIWLQVAKEYGILNGEKKHDNMLWEDHQLYMQGAVDDDPIQTCADARNEFIKRVMQMMGGKNG